MPRSSRSWCAGVWTPRPSPRCSSTAASSGGRNTSWRWCATPPTTSSWSVRSRTSTPMGIHTGDSITVAPAQTLTDVEYQTMRDGAIAVIREIGVEAGGCNIQFAVNPEDGELLVVEMNPRVSRSSALASKATGFPIARVGAKLAVGFLLSELPNDITRTTPASFEPVLDYVVTKFPRFAFEKFPETDRRSRGADAGRGRDHGHRAHLPGIVAEGTAGPRGRPPRMDRGQVPGRRRARGRRPREPAGGASHPHGRASVPAEAGAGGGARGLGRGPGRGRTRRFRARNAAGR